MVTPSSLLLRRLGKAREYRILSLGICLMTALLTFWKVHEDDIWWQIRAGDEILHGHPVQKIDEWSYTVPGQTWTNYQWLSTVLFRIAWSLGGADTLVLLRVSLIGLWMGTIAWILGQVLSARVRVLALVTLVPWAFYSAVFRMHLRPETLGIILYGALIVIWTSRHWLRPERTRHRAWLTLALISLAANFHGGTAVFHLFIGMLFLAFDQGRSLSQRVPWLVGAAISFLGTPQGTAILPELLRHFQYDNTLLFNTEWQPLSWAHFDVTRHGWNLLFWALFAGAGWVQLSRRWLSGRPGAGRHLPGIFANPMVVLLGGTLLTALAFSRIRFIPYQILFFIPVVADLFRGGWLGTRRACLLAAVFWFWLFPALVIQHRGIYGLGVNADSFPVASAEVLREIKPEPNLLSGFMSASYLLLALPEYRDLADPRDVIFNAIKPFIVRAFQSGEVMAQLLEKYTIQTVLVEVPEGGYRPDGSVEDGIERLFPTRDWAAIYQNHFQGILLKRIPAHSKTIAEREYRLLKPGRPPTWYPFQDRDQVGSRDPEFLAEYARCMREDPRNTYCLIARAALHLRDHSSPVEVSKGLEVLKAASAAGASGIHFWSQKLRAHQLLGQTAEAEQTAREMDAWLKSKNLTR